MKSKKEKLTLKDGTPSISGIEQSTLYYWSQLSYKANVHVIAVDLTKEEIYFSEPIFWQAIKLLSNDDSTKTVYLKKANKGSKIVDQLMHEFSQPTIPEILFSHKHALLGMHRLLSFYNDSFYTDPNTHFSINYFANILDLAKMLTADEVETIAKIALSHKCIDSRLKSAIGNNHFEVYSIELWKRNTISGPYSVSSYEGTISNMLTRPPLEAIFPTLLRKIKLLNDKCIKSTQYWREKDPNYLDLCKRTIDEIPTGANHEELSNELNSGLLDKLSTDW